MELEQDDARRLQYWYARANAPQFLYDRLSADPLVRSWSTDLGTEALAAALEALLQEPGSLKRNAEAYALLVAILLSAPHECEALLSSGLLSPLHWAPSLMKIARDSPHTSSGSAPSAKPESPAS